MIPGIDKADTAPLPLPASAWRITIDLTTLIEEQLTAAGYQIFSYRFTDKHRRWELDLSYGGRLAVSVDSEISPGTLSIRVRGETAENIRVLLSSFKRLPILKITRELTSRELLETCPRLNRRGSPSSPAERLKFAVRYLVSTAGYKIVDEFYDPANDSWVLGLKTDQQLQITGVGLVSARRIIVAGFGTDLQPLRQLMALFEFD